MATTTLRVKPLPFFLLHLVLPLVPLALICVRAAAQPSDEPTVAQRIDASVARREKDLLGYTAVEHYAVFRNDSASPVAEMTVKTAYRAESGKTYQILSESGSAFLRKELLERMLDDERDVTQPATRARALIDSSNYTMTMKDQSTIDGRPCVEMQITPRHSATYLFKGSIWVDSRDGAIVRLEGITSKPASIIAGPTRVSRQYTMLDGYPIATHAAANTSVMLLGQVRIAIDYSNYALWLAPGATAGVPEVTAPR